MYSHCSDETDFPHQPIHDDGFGYVCEIIYTFYSANEALLVEVVEQRILRTASLLEGRDLVFSFFPFSRCRGLGVPRALGCP